LGFLNFEQERNHKKFFARKTSIVALGIKAQAGEMYLIENNNSGINCFA
jgi:hypothetical protein